MSTNPTLDGSVVVIANTTTHDAFGGVDTLADGSTLLCVYRQGTDHASTLDGVLRKRSSADDGATWGSATTIHSDGARDLRDVKVLRLRNGPNAGRIVVSFFTWDGTDDDGARAPYVIYSDDDSATWSAPVAITNAFTYLCIVSSITELPSGRIIAGLYGLDDGDSDLHRTARCSYSDDGAETWAHLSTIAAGPAQSLNWGEPQMVVAADGDLVCTLRCDDGIARGNALRITRSPNEGTLWSTPEILWAGSGRPGISRRSSDDALVVMYRHSPTQASRFRASYSDGHGWVQDEGDLANGDTDNFAYGQWVTLDGGQMAAVFSLERSNTDADLHFVKITGGS